MTTVHLIGNAADPDTWDVFENVDNVCDLLLTQYEGHLPDNARIYHKEIAESNDVTPAGSDEQSIAESVKNLLSLDGDIYVLTHPEFFLFGLLGGGIFGTIIKIVIVAVLLFLVNPKPPGPRNQRASSPNNDLSERKNTPRINARIPDIFGQVRSTPDLIAVTYRTYENHQEVEVSYLCIGRGEYETEDIKDDTSLISEIEGTSVAIYGPNTSPNSGDDPVKLIGNAIDDPLLSAKRSNSVTGQVLRAPNLDKIVGNNNLIFKFPNIIEALDNTDVNFTDFFSAGDRIVVSGSGFTGPEDLPFIGGTVNFNIPGFSEIIPGYLIFSVDPNIITLVNPGDTLREASGEGHTDWEDLEIFFRDGETDPGSATLITDSEQWKGPFTLDVSTLTQVFLNFVAVLGLYKDNGTVQKIETVDIEAELEPVDKQGMSIGPVELFTITVFGSETSRSQRAATLKITPTFTGRCKVRCRRTSDTNLGFTGQIADEVKWQDMYAMSVVNETEFGDITSIHSKTIANAGSLSIKERKLNLLATRKIPIRGIGALTASKRVDDIFVAIAVDKKIGNRAIAEVDVDNIYDTIADVEDYFDTVKSVEFGATFDDNELSFEETVLSVSETMFCKPYRIGNVLKISFERQRIDSNLLFCHRNKIPSSEKRSARFGLLDDNDGIEFNYVDGETEDDAQVKYFIPENQSAENPKVVDSLGIRTKLLARFHAYRLFNKLLHQNVGVEFEATSEAALLNINDRVIVTDNTRDNTQDGEVVSQSGLVLTLSQPITFETGEEYTIFLQLSDRTIQTMAVTAGTLEREVILTQAPLLPLVAADDSYLHTMYWIVKNSSTRPEAFLIKERAIKEKGTFNVQVVNYDDRYYSNDLDFFNGVVDTFGDII